MKRQKYTSLTMNILLGQPNKKFTGHGRRMVDNFVDNGSTAIHLLDNNPFGVVVADMQMP